MPQLIHRIPADLYLTKPYTLTKTIQLLPGQRVRQTFGNSTWNCCSFFYVETNPPRNKDFPSTTYFVPSYDNLKTFLTFWAFVEDGGSAIRAFETNEENPSMSEMPDEKSTHWNNGASELHPSEIRLRVANNPSDATFALSELYQKFLQADQTLRDLIALWCFQPNHASQRQVYDNHLMQGALDWIIIDALSPPKRCGGLTTCPKCGSKAYASHVTHSFKDRMEHDLLAHFSDAADYSKVLDAYRECRSSFFHVGKYEDLPITTQPTLETAPGIRRREMTMNELITQFRKEGLATQSAAVLLHDIVHCLLLNRLIPELSLWPRFNLLKMVSFGSIE